MFKLNVSISSFYRGFDLFMVLSGEFGAVFDIGKEIGASSARGFRDEQQ